jgi:hypothetical protein
MVPCHSIRRHSGDIDIGIWGDAQYQGSNCSAMADVILCGTMARGEVFVYNLLTPPCLAKGVGSGVYASVQDRDSDAFLGTFWPSWEEMVELVAIRCKPPVCVISPRKDQPSPRKERGDGIRKKKKKKGQVVRSLMDSSAWLRATPDLVENGPPTFLPGRSDHQIAVETPRNSGIRQIRPETDSTCLPRS